MKRFDQLNWDGIDDDTDLDDALEHFVTKVNEVLQRFNFQKKQPR